MKPPHPFIEHATLAARLPPGCMKMEKRGEQLAPGIRRGGLKHYFAPLACATGAASQILRQSARDRLKQVVGGARQCQDRARLLGLDTSGERGRKIRAYNGRVSGQVAKIAGIPQLGTPGEMIKNCSSNYAAVFSGTHCAQLVADAIACKTNTPLGRLRIGEDV
ncbi:MAG: hypothetical protein JWO04_537 [Gammaproteobacteria bacterium]|nr:hypothetical protein [Gammaproteobacteria bacterium]